MKRQENFLIPPGWDASASNGPIYTPGTWVEGATVRVRCLAQEHSIMSRARTRTAQYAY